MEIKEKLRKPKNPTGNGDNNKTIPKISAPKSPCPKPNIQENNTCSRSNRVSNQIRSTLMWHPSSNVLELYTQL